MNKMFTAGHKDGHVDGIMHLLMTQPFFSGMQKQGGSKYVTGLAVTGGGGEAGEVGGSIMPYVH